MLIKTNQFFTYIDLYIRQALLSMVTFMNMYKSENIFISH